MPLRYISECYVCVHPFLTDRFRLSSSEKLQTAQELSKDHLSGLIHTLDDLDELGEIMTEMLQTQESVEVIDFLLRFPFFLMSS